MKVGAVAHVTNNFKKAKEKLNKKLDKEEKLGIKLFQEAVKEVQKRRTLNWKEKAVSPQETVQPKLIGPASQNQSEKGDKKMPLKK